MEFSQENALFYGKVMGIRALISYEGSNATELVNDFYRTADDYLGMCAKEGIWPDKAYKCNFYVRIPSELISM